MEPEYYVANTFNMRSVLLISEVVHNTQDIVGLTTSDLSFEALLKDGERK